MVVKKRGTMAVRRGAAAIHTAITTKNSRASGVTTESTEALGITSWDLQPIKTDRPLREPEIQSSDCPSRPKTALPFAPLLKRARTELLTAGTVRFRYSRISPLSAIALAILSQVSRISE